MGAADVEERHKYMAGLNRSEAVTVDVQAHMVDVLRGSHCSQRRCRIISLASWRGEPAWLNPSHPRMLQRADGSLSTPS